MLAASDTVPRAAYCMRVLDGMITAEQRDGARTQQQVLEAYRLLAQQRPLNETEQKSYAFAQVMHSEFLRRMENTRSRLAGYLATNGLLKGFLADDGALDDFPGIALALNRGQADHSWCEVEKDAGSFLHRSLCSQMHNQSKLHSGMRWELRCRSMCPLYAVRES